MKVVYKGTLSAVVIPGYGEHERNAEFELPDEVAKALIAGDPASWGPGGSRGAKVKGGE